jgi:hypothetical protein
MHLGTPLSMRGHIPPPGAGGTAYPPGLRRVLHGLQRGAPAAPGRLTPGIPSRRHLWAAQAQVWLRHRARAPAQAADALEPKGPGEGAGLPRYCPVCPADHPGGAHRPTDVPQGHWERRNLQPPSVAKVPRRSRRQPEAAGAPEARSSQGPGEADVGPVCCKGKPCVRGHGPQHRACPCRGPGTTSHGRKGSAMASASKSGGPEPRNETRSAPYTSCSSCACSPGRLACERCVVSPRTTGGNTPRDSMGPSPSPRPNAGDWPTRYTSLAPPPRSDASGDPNVEQGRQSAHWACPPQRTGHGKRSGAKPWNPQGKPTCPRTPMAFAQAGPAMRPSAPS